MPPLPVDGFGTAAGLGEQREIGGFLARRRRQCEVRVVPGRKPRTLDSVPHQPHPRKPVGHPKVMADDLLEVAEMVLLLKK